MTLYLEVLASITLKFESNSKKSMQ